MQYGKLILDIWSISWLLAFFYSLSQILRKRPRLKFKSSWSAWSAFEKDWMDFYRLSISWTLKNQSLEPTSINVIHTVVRSNRKKHSTLRHSIWVDKIMSNTDAHELRLPIMLEGHEAKSIVITSEFPIKWTCDENLLTQYKDIWWWFKIPKYEYKLLFEDVNENVFDDNWVLCNMEESDLRWTICNTTHELKDGKIREFIKHYLKIIKSKIKFRFKILWLYIWIWK